MWEAIAGLISIAVMILRFYLKKPQKRRTYEGDIAEMDRAIANRDVDTISRLFNELRPPTRGRGDPSRQNDNKTS